MTQIGDEGPVTPTFRNDYDHEYDHDDNQHHFQRRSVLAKVKEKARRWRQRLARKKQVSAGEEEPTPAWGVSLEEDDDEWDEQEYHGGPMYQSEMAPNPYKQTPPPPPPPPPPEQTSQITEPSNKPSPPPSPPPEETTESPPEPPKQWPLNPFDDEEDMQMITAPSPPPPFIPRSGSIKRIADALASVLLTPAYNIVSGATQIITSKIQGPARDEIEAKKAWDKRASVTEYLRDKLEPGEEERALSEVITEVISPRKAAERRSEEGGGVKVVKREVVGLSGEEERGPSEVVVAGGEGVGVGVVEKVRAIVSSLIWRKKAVGSGLSVSPTKSACG